MPIQSQFFIYPHSLPFCFFEWWLSRTGILVMSFSLPISWSVLSYILLTSSYKFFPVFSGSTWDLLHCLIVDILFHCPRSSLFPIFTVSMLDIILFRSRLLSYKSIRKKRRSGLVYIPADFCLKKTYASAHRRTWCLSSEKPHSSCSSLSMHLFLAYSDGYVNVCRVSSIVFEKSSLWWPAAYSLASISIPDLNSTTYLSSWTVIRSISLRTRAS